MTDFCDLAMSLLELDYEAARRGRFVDRTDLDWSAWYARFYGNSKADESQARWIVRLLAAELGVSPGALRPSDSVDGTLSAGVNEPWDDGVQGLFLEAQAELERRGVGDNEVKSVDDLVCKYGAFLARKESLGNHAL